MMPSHSGYGRFGTLGIATPQANPTAEPEFRAPSEGVEATVRMHSNIDAPDQRLLAYHELGSTLSRFDTPPYRRRCCLHRSSYLLGHGKDISTDSLRWQMEPHHHRATAIEALLTLSQTHFTGKPLPRLVG